MSCISRSQENCTIEVKLRDTVLRRLGPIYLMYFLYAQASEFKEGYAKEKGWSRWRFAKSSKKDRDPEKNVVRGKYALRMRGGGGVHYGNRRSWVPDSVHGFYWTYNNAKLIQSLNTSWHVRIPSVLFGYFWIFIALSMKLKEDKCEKQNFSTPVKQFDLRQNAQQTPGLQGTTRGVFWHLRPSARPYTLAYFSFSGRHPVCDWTTEDVSNWLHVHGFDEYRDTFVANDVRGRELMSLCRSDLKVGLRCVCRVVMHQVKCKMCFFSFLNCNIVDKFCQVALKHAENSGSAY